MPKFFNHYEVEDAARRWRNHPLLGPATKTLESLMHAVDANSDGWPYWRAPQNASAKLVDLIDPSSNPRAKYDDERDDVTLAKLKAAYVPLRSFRTRSGLAFTIYEPRGETRNRPSHPHSRADRVAIAARLTRRNGRRRYRGR